MGNYMAPNQRADSRNELLLNGSNLGGGKNRGNIDPVRQSRLRFQPNYHVPTPFKSDDIFQMYNKVIEEDFAFNQQLYSTTIKNKFSVFANAKNDYVEVQKKPVQSSVMSMSRNFGGNSSNYQFRDSELGVQPAGQAEMLTKSKQNMSKL